jgi:hypothetical protein
MMDSMDGAGSNQQNQSPALAIGKCFGIFESANILVLDGLSQI